ncbi:hypothetical protein C8R44DRAFT_872000 [Mycena epipterygia]|nr:hypothetical protein C8R44DRAFT_872000 [Mycena epipterygia]
MIGHTDATTISALHSIMDDSEPPYPGFFKAMLIATNSTGYRLVRVPVRHGAKLRPGHTTIIEDLDLTPWIDPGSSVAASTLDLDELTHTVHRFPRDSLIILNHPYTVVVAPQGFNLAVAEEDRHPINRIVNRYVPGLQLPWRGNVLVLKHGSSAIEGRTAVIDMTITETALARVIALRAIEEGCIGRS